MRYDLSTMSEAAKKHATYEDVLSAPENHVAQILDGELHVHPRPARRHLRAASALGARLVHERDAGPTGSGGAWIIRFEPELHLGRDVVIPDLAGWRVERFPRDADRDPDEPFFQVAPDWVCEVLSASTARIDRVKKAPIYARERLLSSGSSTRVTAPSRCSGSGRRATSSWAHGRATRGPSPSSRSTPSRSRVGLLGARASP